MLTPEEVKASSFEGLKTLATAGLNFDLMYMRFILLHEKSNANGDYFTREELEESWYTWVYKPVTWEHGQPYIGFITDAILVKPSEDSPDPRWYIECAAVIWKNRYPFEAMEIYHGSNDGSYKMSMEVYFTDALYAVGDNLDKLYTADDAPYLVDLRGKTYQGEPVYRVLIGIHGAGAGVVARPADEDALILEVASKNNKIVIDREQCAAHFVVYNIGDVLSDLQLEEAAASSQDENITKKEDAGIMEEQIIELQNKIDELTKAKSDLEASLDAVTLERDTLQSVLAEKDEELSNLNSELEKITTEYNEYKEAVEREKAEAAKDKLANDRLSEIVASGVDVKEDSKAKLISQLREMSDETYATFREILIQNVSTASKAPHRQTPPPVLEATQPAPSLEERYEKLWEKAMTDDRVGSELN